MFTLKLDGETYSQWLQIAVDKKFELDNDVAQLLIRHYQETSEGTPTLRHCIGCLSPVALYTYCDKCNLLVQQTSVASATTESSQNEEAAAGGTTVPDAPSSASALPQSSNSWITAPTVISLQSVTPVVTHASDGNVMSVTAPSPVLTATFGADKNSTAVAQTFDGSVMPVSEAQLTTPLPTVSSDSDVLSAAVTQTAGDNMPPAAEPEFASPISSLASGSYALPAAVAQASDRYTAFSRLSSPVPAGASGGDILSVAVTTAQITSPLSSGASDNSACTPGDDTITVYVDDAGNIITTSKKRGTRSSRPVVPSGVKQSTTSTEGNVNPLSPTAPSAQVSGGCSGAQRVNTRKRLSFSEPDNGTIGPWESQPKSDNSDAGTSKTQGASKLLVSSGERQRTLEPDSTVNLNGDKCASEADGFVTSSRGQNTSTNCGSASGRAPKASSSGGGKKMRTQSPVRTRHPPPKLATKQKQSKGEPVGKIPGMKEGSSNSQMSFKTPAKSSKQFHSSPSKRPSSTLSLKDQKHNKSANGVGIKKTDETGVRRSGRERRPTWKMLSAESDDHTENPVPSDVTSRPKSVSAETPMKQKDSSPTKMSSAGKLMSSEMSGKQKNVVPSEAVSQHTKPAGGVLKSGDAAKLVKDCVVVLERLTVDKADTSLCPKINKQEKANTEVQHSPEPDSSDEIFVYTDYDDDDDYMPDCDEESDEDGNAKPKCKMFDFDLFLPKKFAKKTLSSKTKTAKSVEVSAKPATASVVSKSVTSSSVTVSSSAPITSSPTADVGTQVPVDTNGGLGMRVPVQVTLTTTKTEGEGGDGGSILQAVIQPLDPSGTWEEMSKSLGKYRPILPKPEGYDAEMEKKALEAAQKAEADSSGMDGTEASWSKDSESSEEKTQPRPGVRKYSCSECSKKFYGSNDLRRHLRTHTGEKPYLCHACGAAFRLAQGLKHHRERQACIKHIRRQEKMAMQAAKLSQTGVKDEGYMKRRFVCAVCDKRFLASNDLKKHMRTHTGERPFACLQCPKRFSLKQALRAHMQCRHPNEIDEAEKAAAEERRQKYQEDRQMPRTEDGRYPCEECHKTYGTRKDLKVHMRCHTGEKPYICETCGKSFKYQQNLKLHYRVHNGKRSHICPDCGAAFYTASDLETHSRIHTDDRPYVCEECGAAFISSNNLQVHMRSLHSGDRPHVCSVCQAAFTTRRQLDIHAKLHTADRPYICMECGEGFPTHIEMKQHRKSHSGLAQFRCRHCPEMFSTEKLLALHMETHRKSAANSNQTDGQASPLRCENCQQNFSDLSQYQEHSVQCRKNQCSWCGSTFKSGARLREHVRIHTGERPYICRVCGAAFRTQPLVKTHMRSHTGFKPHVCTLCNKGFSNSGSLKMHMRCHTGERPYGCNFCSLAFNQAAALKRHLYTHSDTTPRPFVCDTCGACFMSEGVLKRHFASHKQAGERIVVCSMCQASISVPANIQVGTGDQNEILVCEQCAVSASETLSEETSQLTSLTPSAGTDGIGEESCDVIEEKSFASQDIGMMAEENSGITEFVMNCNTGDVVMDTVVTDSDGLVIDNTANKLASAVTEGSLRENTHIVVTQGVADEPANIVLTDGTSHDGANIIITDGIADENASFIVAEGMVDGSVGVVLTDGMVVGEDGITIEGANSIEGGFPDQQVYEITLTPADP